MALGEDSLEVEVDFVEESAVEPSLGSGRSPRLVALRFGACSRSTAGSRYTSSVPHTEGSVAVGDRCWELLRQLSVLSVNPAPHSCRSVASTVDGVGVGALSGGSGSGSGCEARSGSGTRGVYVQRSGKIHRLMQAAMRSRARSSHPYPNPHHAAFASVLGPKWDPGSSFGCANGGSGDGTVWHTEAVRMRSLSLHIDAVLAENGSKRVGLISTTHTHTCFEEREILLTSLLSVQRTLEVAASQDCLSLLLHLDPLSNLHMGQLKQSQSRVKDRAAGGEQFVWGSRTKSEGRSRDDLPRKNMDIGGVTGSVVMEKFEAGNSMLSSASVFYEETAALRLCMERAVWAVGRQWCFNPR